MSSSTNDVKKERFEQNIPYKPGTFRYQDVPPDERKRLFKDRQLELNPCLKVRKLPLVYM